MSSNFAIKSNRDKCISGGSVVKVFLAFFLALQLTACGGGGGSSESSVPDPNPPGDNGGSADNGDNGVIDPPESEIVVPMILNQVYEVAEGQAVQKTSDSAEIEMTVNIETGVTSVVLLSGSANLITPI